MKKKVRVILSPEAKETYNQLLEKSENNKFERSILNAINKKTELNSELNL